MTEDVATLLRLLDEEAARYTMLLQLARRKADLLSSRADAAEIEAVANEEASLIDEVLPLERDRLAVMRRLAASLEDKVPQLTVSALCARLPGDVSHRLSRATASLSATLEELRTVNRLNAALLQQELALVNFSLDLLTNTAGRGTYANPAGTPPAGGCPAFLDARA
ncbi:MAG: flagellar protein FlgN [Bacillota bacterium]|nr:flagellar protein FlgN [Bacillota bacterium]